MATLPCSTRHPVSVPRAMMASSAKPVAVSGGGRFGSFPDFKGLRIQYPLKPSVASLRSRNPRVCRQRGGIVCEAQDVALDIPNVNESTWQSLVIDTDSPVLVEFWAPWCGPCRVILPDVASLAKQYAGKLKCYKLNTDESPSIATQYGIRSIPTIMIFIKGEKKDTIIGAVPKTTLAASIEKFL